MHPFAIDFRSLSLFRICLGSVAAYYLVTHVGLFAEFHSAQKAATSQTVQSYFGGDWRSSLNWLSESSAYQIALLVAGFAAAGSLIVGWHATFATFGCWLLVISLNNKVPYIAGGGDALLCVLLFWSLFLPLGQRWSLDARQGRSSDSLAAETLVSAATAAILLQMAMMYLFTGISKWNEYWIDGTALDVIFSSDSFVRPFGKFLKEFPLVTSVLTRTTIWAELLLPLAMFSPWKTTACRTVAVIVFMSFHVGIELSLTVPIFSFVSCAGLLLFVPSRWWDFFPLGNLEKLLDAPRGAPQLASQQSRQLRRQRERTGSRKAGNRIESTLPAASNRWLQRLLALAVVYVFLSNLLLMFGSNSTIQRLHAFRQPGFLLGLNQHWNMFNYPPALCTDVACVGKLRDGRHVDLLRAGQVVDDRKQPPTDPLVGCSTRMLNGLVLLAKERNQVFREGFTRYLCQRWNETAGDADQQIVECFLTYYPRQHHPLAKAVISQDLFHLDLLSQGALVAGKREGPWVLYHENGQKMSAGNYQRGKAEGKWTFWDTAGKKAAEGIMRQGKPAGEWKHYEGGQLKIVNHSLPADPVEPP